MKLGLLAAAALTAASPGTVAPPEDRRGPEQTFLTVPEWFLVFSPEEYATFLKTSPPSGFPFFGEIGQFWQSYSAVTGATSEYPFNAGYHVMVSVIGLSTTAEYGLKGLYERLIGHFTELTSGGFDTAEDRIARHTAQSYVDFIKQAPWYEFNFGTPLAQLWSGSGMTGEISWRRLERRYGLTSEYLVKAGYAALIEKATRASYERPLPDTHVVIHVNGVTRSLKLPRYQAFTPHAQALAAEGQDFVEIAGNRGDILVSVVASRGAAPVAKAKVLYRQPILARPERERQALVVKIHDLGSVLRSIPSQTQVEHIYDF